ncbi:MAG: hypothetical protein LIP28_07925, partial [Deltaproteobacteria bacterium]|nr:hypothetical protein [Deltaproteobacteria bacterium]
MSSFFRNQLLRQAVFVGAVCGALLLAAPGTGLAASSAVDAIEQQIRQEQAKAKARRESLSRLTAEERSLDTELAAAERRILAIEATLENAARTLDSLSASDLELQAEAKTLKEEQRKTEEAMTEVLRVLWELHARRVGVKGRDLPDWPVTDREHTWSLELFSSLDAYRKTIAEQQKELEAVASKREKLNREVASR